MEATQGDRGAPMLAWMHEAQQQKLNERADHGDWQQQLVSDLWEGALLELRDEAAPAVNMAIEALGHGNARLSPERGRQLLDDVRYEIADACNYLTKAADVLRRRIEEAVARYEAAERETADHV